MPLKALPLKTELNLLYWNCNGIGADWDGNTSRKMEMLKAGNRYDAIAIAEHHIRAATPPLDDWVFSDPASPTDTHAGVAIWISPRLQATVRSKGRVGTRLAWFKLAWFKI